MAAQTDYTNYKNASPLVIHANSLNVPSQDMKFLPKYGIIGKINHEHYQEVAFLSTSFNIIKDSVMMRLLSFSFEGKVVEWFKNLPSTFINT